MPNLDTLDTVIAIVVVLLVLSLLVQAIQSFIKKIFKLKSRQIEKSLLLLFKNVIEKPAPGLASPPASPPSSPATEPITPEKLVERVLKEFKNIGRSTKWNNPVLDSISKEDLLKILAKIDSKHFFADYVTKFEDLYRDIQELESEMQKLVNGNLLQGAASAKFAEMREVLSPLINDVKNLVKDGTVKDNVIFGDLLNLRRVKLEDVLKLLAEAQESVTADLKAEREAKNDVTVAALQQLSAGLTRIAAILGNLSQRMDAAFATLRAKLDHVETWYDTVMQSFEESYTRHMKNVAIYVSIGVVIFLNASFFRIYHSISTNDLQRNLILQEGQELVDEAKKNREAENANGANANGNGNSNTAAFQRGGRTPNVNSGGNTNSSSGGNINSNSGTTAQGNANSGSNANSGGNTNSGTTNPGGAGGASGGGANGGNSNSANSQDQADDEAIKELKAQREVVNKYVSKYENFGFSPLTLQQVRFFLRSLVGYTPTRDKDGELTYADYTPIPDNCATTKAGCEPGYRDMKFEEWWEGLKQDASTLVGWALMVLLLSVGAPFWQDTLESLFGVKNLLRKKSDTKNVETESGAGQPKP